MKSSVKLFIAVCLLALNVYAEGPVCPNLDECLKLQKKVETRIKELKAGTVPNFGEPVKISPDTKKTCRANFVDQGDDPYCYMREDEAEGHCKKLGGRIPNIRDWSELAMSMGAVGIIEVDKYHNEPGYSLIDSDSDKFYYNEKGFQNPDTYPYWGDGSAGFWTSSTTPRSCTNIPNMPHRACHTTTFLPLNGTFRAFIPVGLPDDTGSLFPYNAVRCVF